MFALTPDIFSIIKASPDTDASIAAFAAAFCVESAEIRASFVSMLGAETRQADLTAFRDTVAKYSAPKTILAMAEKAATLGCTILLGYKDGNLTIDVIDPKAAIGKKVKKGSVNRYFVDGKPLFDSYRSIADAMRKLGGYERILDAVGPGNAHKIEPTRYGPNTSLNAWQALIALGTDTQKARITRSQG